MIGILESGLSTAVIWGLFGLAAGALYGLWAGRATSARRLKGIGPILARGTSTLQGWAETPTTEEIANTLTEPGRSQQLALTFRATTDSAVLEPARTLFLSEWGE